MLFWTADLTDQFRDWLDSTTENILCCEHNPWSSTSSYEFENRLSYGTKRPCISLNADGEKVKDIIESVWRHVASNDSVLEQFLDKVNKHHSDELRKNIDAGLLPDLGIYDCVDLLAHLGTDTILCIRITSSVPSYLKPWIEYINSTTRIKVLLLHPPKVHHLLQLSEFNRMTLHKFSNEHIVDACQHAVFALTGSYMPQSELDFALSDSQSLNEFIAIVQTATLYQCSPSSLQFAEFRPKLMFNN